MKGLGNILEGISLDDVSIVVSEGVEECFFRTDKTILRNVVCDDSRLKLVIYTCPH